MNDSIYELLLVEKEKGISYLIDVFQENTLSSQEIILDMITRYRETFSNLDKAKFILNFRYISQSGWNNNTQESILNIKGVDLFYYSEKSWISFENQEKLERGISILETVNFKL